jgi:hypothetical protein
VSQIEAHHKRPEIVKASVRRLKIVQAAIPLQTRAVAEKIYI